MNGEKYHGNRPQTNGLKKKMTSFFVDKTNKRD